MVCRCLDITMNGYKWIISSSRRRIMISIILCVTPKNYLDSWRGIKHFRQGWRLLLWPTRWEAAFDLYCVWLHRALCCPGKLLKTITVYISTDIWHKCTPVNFCMCQYNFLMCFYMKMCDFLVLFFYECDSYFFENSEWIERGPSDK